MPSYPPGAYLQHPAFDESVFYQEAVLDWLPSAKQGVGIFAFATVGGISLLLRDPDFQHYLKFNVYRLIVGVDAITNEAALVSLAELQDEYKNFKPCVYYDPDSQSLFHPKVCIFEVGMRYVTFIGSNNLTPGGMRGNVEAFSIMEQSSSPIDAFLYTLHQQHHFYDVRDPTILRRARSNTGHESPDSPMKSLSLELIRETPQGALSVAGLTTDKTQVLIAELPKGKRWKQANFHKHVFEGFFEASPDKSQRFMFTHVDERGALGVQEIRPSVSVSSNNYRFELDAATGLEYPDGALRPIAVFAKLGTRTFRYHLSMPGSSSHQHLHDYLQANAQPTRTGGMRSIVVHAKALRDLWPGSMLLLDNS